jgi:CheY-like chemotaxis protein
MEPLNDTERKTILLVDDEDGVRFFLEKLLVHEGYTIINARNGKKAVEIYKAGTTPIDLVLMDINMPVMDGLEAHKELMQFDPEVAIVFMSAYSQDWVDDLENIHFIRKPMKPAELFNKIDECLNFNVRS